MSNGPEPISHGTIGGFWVEWKRGEPHCADCREAQRTYLREWRQRTGRYRNVRMPIPLLRRIAAVITDPELAAQIEDLLPGGTR